MASPTRPYLVDFQGTEHLIQAISKEQAVSLVVAQHVKGVKAASAAEVMAFYQRQQEKAVTSVNEDAHGEAATGPGTYDPEQQGADRGQTGEDQQD